MAAEIGTALFYDSLLNFIRKSYPADNVEAFHGMDSMLVII